MAKRVIAKAESAYEIAVRKGFIGTEAEWLASLEGSDGADGNHGVYVTEDEPVGVPSGTVWVHPTQEPSVVVDLEALAAAVVDANPTIADHETRLVLATTRVNAAGYATLQDALNAGAGKTVYIGPGSYSISAPLVPAAGTTIELHPNAVIEQTTNWTPVFDVLDAPDVRILGGQLEWNGARSMINLGSTRGAGLDEMLCGVWTNSDRTTVAGVHLYGFQPGITVSGWNGTAQEHGHTKDVLIEDITVDTVTYGLLAFGTDGLSARNVRGTWEDFTDGGIAPPPGHLVYLSNTVDNYNPTIADCYGYDGGNGVAYQFKGVYGGSATNLHASNCPGLLNMLSVQDMKLANIGVRGTTSEVPYAVDFGDANIKRVTINGLSITRPGNAGRALKIDGSDNVVRDVTVTASSTNAYSFMSAMEIYGTRNRLENPTLIENGTGWYNIVHTLGTSCQVTNPATNKAAYAVRVLTGSGTIEYDPARLTLLLNHTVGFDSGTSGRVVMPPTRYTTNQAAGSTVEPWPMKQTVRAINATGATLTIMNPVDSPPPTGHQFTIELKNSSGGALTVTWGAAYVFNPAWASPATGKTTFITFQYDGTNWLEVSRTA